MQRQPQYPHRPAASILHPGSGSEEPPLKSQKIPAARSEVRQLLPSDCGVSGASSRVIAYVRTQIAGVDPADRIAVFSLIAGTAVVGKPSLDLVHPAGFIAYIKPIESMLRLEALIEFLYAKRAICVADVPDPE